VVAATSGSNVQGRAMIVERTLRSIIAGLMLVMFLAVFSQVVLRYLTYQPVAWTEELSRFSFIWLCLLGAAEGARMSAHFAVDLLPRNMTGLPGRLLRGMLKLGEALLYLSVAWAGISILPIVQDQHSVTLNFSMGIAYAAIPVGMGLMAVFSAVRAREEFAGRRISL
jgi:TRAP-type C4-dicarboxylate transport system permease small subunit